MNDGIFKHGIKNELRPKAGWHNMKMLFGKKIGIRGFNIILGGLALLIIGMILSNCPNCPEQEECAECEQCPECEECAEPEIQEKLKIFNTYVCSDGTIAGDPKDCLLKEEQNTKYICGDGNTVDFPEQCEKELEVDTEYYKEDNELFLAIEDIDYEMKGDDWGTITQISYAVLNGGEASILPQIQIKVYDQNDSASKKAEIRHTIKLNQTLEKDEFVQDYENVYISFKGTNVSMKFVLVNGLEEVPGAQVVLERPLE